MNSFVTRLNYDTNDVALQSAFEEYGEVSSAKIIFDKATGKSKGFGFVEMPDDGEGKAAIDGLNETELDGRTIVVKESEPREQRPRRDDRRGGYGGGGGRGGDRGSYGGGRDRNSDYNRY